MEDVKLVRQNHFGRILLSVAAGALLVVGVSAALATFPQEELLTRAHASESEVINWQKSLSQAKQDAKSSAGAGEKYILVDVYTDWCGWCKRLDKVTFQDPDFGRYLADKYICVKANAEQGAENEKIARDFKVDGFPCGLLFKGDGKFIGKVGGYQEPAQYRATLEKLIARDKANPRQDPFEEIDAE